MDCEDKGFTSNHNHDLINSSNLIQDCLALYQNGKGLIRMVIDMSLKGSCIAYVPLGTGVVRLKLLVV